jgi:antitoxin ParD1/3/4
MPTRNVVLTERHETLIEALIQSGRYQNASEVMREGLRLVESREVGEASKLAALRDAAMTGLASIAETSKNSRPPRRLPITSMISATALFLARRTRLEASVLEGSPGRRGCKGFCAHPGLHQGHVWASASPGL